MLPGLVTSMYLTGIYLIVTITKEETIITNTQRGKVIIVVIGDKINQHNSVKHGRVPSDHHSGSLRGWLLS